MSKTDDNPPPQTSKTRAVAKHQGTTELVVTLSAEDLQALHWAYRHLEHPSLAARLTSIIGTPIEVGLHLLPEDWYGKLHASAERAIEKALSAAISSMHHAPDSIMAHEHFHKMLGMTSGAVGGLFGLLGLLVELPISTTLILRSIADIARSEGESLEALDSRLACLKVFALGGRSEEDDAAETGYYGVRLALSLTVSNAAQHIAEKGLTREGGPALVSLISAISSRFGAVVSEKAAAQLLPLLGAVGGAAINAIFMQHFQDMARGHFTVRRLERKYGSGPVKAAYDALAGT